MCHAKMLKGLKSSCQHQGFLGISGSLEREFKNISERDPSDFAENYVATRGQCNGLGQTSRPLLPAQPLSQNLM